LVNNSLICRQSEAASNLSKFLGVDFLAALLHLKLIDIESLLISMKTAYCRRCLSRRRRNSMAANHGEAAQGLLRVDWLLLSLGLFIIAAIQTAHGPSGAILAGLSAAGAIYLIRFQAEP